MVKPLTKYTREVWADMAADVLMRPKKYPPTLGSIRAAEERLRYEQTIQDVEARCGELLTALRDADGALRHHPGGDNRLTPNIYKAAAIIKEVTS